MIIHQTHSKEFKSLRRREMDPQPTRSSLMSKTLYTTFKNEHGFNIENDS